MAEQDFVIFLLSTDTAVTVNDDKIFGHRNAVQAAQIIFQRFAPHGMLQNLFNFIENSFFVRGKFFQRFDKFVRIGLIHFQRPLRDHATSFFRNGILPGFSIGTRKTREMIK